MRITPKQLQFMYMILRDSIVNVEPDIFTFNREARRAVFADIIEQQTDNITIVEGIEIVRDVEEPKMHSPSKQQLKKRDIKLVKQEILSCGNCGKNLTKEEKQLEQCSICKIDINKKSN